MAAEPNNAVLIVCGASPHAERVDRPIAYRLAGRIAVHAPRLPPALVLSDLWYLNHDALRDQPTIAIGRPSVNALSAFLGDKLPSVLAIEERLLVQMDPELADRIACCWGISDEDTAAAVDAFAERYLGVFLEGIGG